MQRTVPFLFTLISAALLGLYLGGPRAIAQQRHYRLPGARAVIDAGDYASLQAALDALPPAGGLVRIPPGVYEISAPLVLATEDVHLQGSGPATHIRNLNAEGQPALLIRSKDLEQNPRARLWRVQISDLRLTGNPRSGHGIEARGVNEILIDGVTVSYHGGDGIRLDHCYEDPRVVNSLITYNQRTGLELLGCHDIVVSANQFEENRDALRCLDSFNLTMSGNNLDDHLRHGVVIENTYGSVLSGNMIEECQGTAIILNRDCYGITLSANVIAHNSGGGIDLQDAHGCAVSANTFTINPRGGLVLGPDCSRIAVTGNSFSDSFIGGSKVKRRANDRAATGILLDAGADNIAITGNTFSGLSGQALTLQGQSFGGVLFTSNLLVGVESDHGRLPAQQRVNNLVRPGPAP